MKTTAQLLKFTLLIVIVSGTIFLWGCGNDNPKPASNSISIDITALRQQLGAPSLSQSANFDYSAPNFAVANAVTDGIKTILVGPVTFRYHCSNYNKDDKCLAGATSLGIYNTDNGFTQKEQDQLVDDITQSANLIKYIPFDSSVTEVELEVPEEGLGKWQVFAIGSKKVLANNDDLDKDENDDALTYVGMTKQYFTSAEDLNSKNVTIKLIRGCSLSDTPLGCAVYHDDGAAKVTTAVEIIEVEVVLIDGTKYTVTDPSTSNYELEHLPFPWIIRDPVSGTEMTPAQAKEFLPKIKPDGDWTIKETFTTTGASYYQKIKSIKITTTHQNSLTESTACKNSQTVSELKANCEIQTYPKFYYY